MNTILVALVKRLFETILVYISQLTLVLSLFHAYRKIDRFLWQLYIWIHDITLTKANRFLLLRRAPTVPVSRGNFG